MLVQLLYLFFYNPATGTWMEINYEIYLNFELPSYIESLKVQRLNWYLFE